MTGRRIARSIGRGPIGPLGVTEDTGRPGADMDEASQIRTAGGTMGPELRGL